MAPNEDNGDRAAISVLTKDTMTQISQAKASFERSIQCVGNMYDTEEQMTRACQLLQQLNDELKAIHKEVTKRAPTPLTIPREIRDMILWDLLIQSGPAVLFLDKKQAGKPKKIETRSPQAFENMSALRSTCRQLEKEATELYFSENVFECWPSPRVRRSGFAISEHHLPLIKHLATGKMPIPVRTYPLPTTFFSLSMHMHGPTVEVKAKCVDCPGNEIFLVPGHDARPTWAQEAKTVARVIETAKRQLERSNNINPGFGFELGDVWTTVCDIEEFAFDHSY